MAAARRRDERGLLRRLLDALLLPFSAKRRRERQERMLDRYFDALDAMDWMYLFSRDSASFLKGKQLHQRALVLQMKVDPTGEIWMRRPEAQRIGAPRPVVAGGVR